VTQPVIPTFSVVGQRVAAVGSLAVLAVAAVVSPHSALAVRAIPAAAALVWAAAALLHPGPGAAIAVLVAALTSMTAAGMVWQVAMPSAIAVLFFASRACPSLGTVRESAGRAALGATFVCAAVTPFALLGWLALLHPDVSDLTRGLPRLDRRVLVLGGIAFALLNATCEEWIWRGIIQRRLTAIFPAYLAVSAQALSFGIMHAHGFPRGRVGVMLASSWALMLGALRRHSSGLLAPTAAHVVADATIATILILRMH